MIVEIAFDLEPSEKIAYRYGYTPEDFVVLRATEWFDRALEIKRAELRASGWTSKQKFTLMAEDLMEQAYRFASASDNAQTKLEVAKYAAKLADIEPKANGPASLVGTGFSININLSGGKVHASQHEIIEVPKTSYGSDLPPLPSYLSKLPFESLAEST